MTVGVEVQSAEADLRSRAVERLKKKQEFRVHAMAYVLVNAMLVTVWALTGASFFWPIFPLVGWGIGLAAHAMEAYGREPSEERIRREIERLR